MTDLNQALNSLQQQEQMAGIARQFHAHTAAGVLAELMGVEYQRQLAIAIEEREREENIAPGIPQPPRIQIQLEYAAMAAASVAAADQLCAALGLPVRKSAPQRTT